jgi:hypothetical protein
MLMNYTNTARMIVGAALATAAAACSSDEPTGPGNHQLDLPGVLAQMSTSTGSFTDAAGQVLGISVPSSADATVAPSACTYSGATQGFNCATRTVDGLTFSASYYLLDAAGNSQTAPSSTTTASVRLVTDLAGTVTESVSGTTGSVTVAQRNDLTMAGLLTDQHVLTGTSVNHDSTVINGASLSRIVDDLTSTADNVVFPRSGSSSPWPLSGSIAADVAAKVTLGAIGPVSTSVHAVLTFNGTNLVPLTTSDGTSTNTCTIDLSGRATPVCSE